MSLRASIFPSVARRAFLAEVGEDSTVFRPIAGDLIAMLVVESPDIIRGLSPGELAASEFANADEAWDAAISNLVEQFSEGKVPVQVAQVEGDVLVALAGPHWLASSIVLLPGLHAWMCDALRTSGIHLALPSRESAIVFPGDAASPVLDRVRRFVSDGNSGSRRPLGHSRLQISQDESVALAEQVTI